MAQAGLRHSNPVGGCAGKWSGSTDNGGSAGAGRNDAGRGRTASPGNLRFAGIARQRQYLARQKQLERTVYHFLGPNKSIDNVEAARAAVEDLYRTNGYQTVAVDIPEQDVKNGVVYLQVVEGKVSRLRVKDSRYFRWARSRPACRNWPKAMCPTSRLCNSN